MRGGGEVEEQRDNKTIECLWWSARRSKGESNRCKLPPASPQRKNQQKSTLNPPPTHTHTLRHPNHVRPYVGGQLEGLLAGGERVVLAPEAAENRDAEHVVDDGQVGRVAVGHLLDVQQRRLPPFRRHPVELAAQEQDFVREQVAVAELDAVVGVRLGELVPHVLRQGWLRGGRVSNRADANPVLASDTNTYAHTLLSRGSRDAHNNQPGNHDVAVPCSPPRSQRPRSGTSGRRQSRLPSQSRQPWSACRAARGARCIADRKERKGRVRRYYTWNGTHPTNQHPTER